MPSFLCFLHRERGVLTCVVPRTRTLHEGYSIESPNAPPGWDESGASTVGAMSTPEWARAVAAGDDDAADAAAAAEESSNDDGDDDDGLDDPFAHVAKQPGEWDDDDVNDAAEEGEGELIELSYANKKRLFLEFSRDRPDVFRRISERELYSLADHPMRPNQGHSSGRKQVNALRRLREHFGIDDSDLRGRGECAAADHPSSTSGEASSTFSHHFEHAAHF